jgi:hypothetical protein
VHAKLYVDPPHLDASDVLDANIRCLIKFDARTSRWTINNTIHALLSKSLSGAAQPGKPCTASDHAMRLPTKTGFGSSWTLAPDRCACADSSTFCLTFRLRLARAGMLIEDVAYRSNKPGLDCASVAVRMSLADELDTGSDT